MTQKKMNFFENGKIFLLLTFFLFSFSNISKAQTKILSKEKETSIDSLFIKWNKSQSPGMSVGVLSNNEFIYSKSFGLANLEWEIPFSFETSSYLASCSKQFTAFAIYLLEERKKLSLQDDIRKYLPDFPDYGDTIMIQHLIHHTSGVRDFLVLQSLRGKKSFLNFYTEKEIYNLLIAQKSLNFAPGEKTTYSNSGYFLLKLIIEKVAGIPYSEFIQSEIFEPLGMKNSKVLTSTDEIISHYGFGYRLNGEEFKSFSPNFVLQGPGGIVSTQNDIRLWLMNFSKPMIGSVSTIEKMQSPAILNNGKSILEAGGLLVENYKKRKYVYHTGNNQGTSACIMRLPEKQLAVIILSNQGNIPVENMAFDVIDIMMDEYSNRIPSVSPQSKISISSEQKNFYRGVYLSEDGDVLSVNDIDGQNLSLSINGGTERVIIPDSSMVFNVQNKSWVLHFKNKKESLFQNIELTVGNETLKASRYLGLDSLMADQYTGQFYCPDLKASYFVEYDRGNLTIKLEDSFSTQKLFPILYELEIGLMTDGDKTYFRFSNKNSEEKWSEMEIIEPRARNIKFERK